MWQNLSDQTRQRIAAAGPCEVNSLGDLKPGSDYHKLFVQYFTDNCHDEEASRRWECYWWLSSQDLSSFHPKPGEPGDGRYRFRPHSQDKRALLAKFESRSGPQGATPIDWPSEISEWFTTRNQLKDEEQTRRQAWNREAWNRFADDEEQKAVWQAWAKAFDKLNEWEQNNPVPIKPALRFCRDAIQGWWAAFHDEIRNINQAVPGHRPGSPGGSDRTISLSRIRNAPLRAGENAMTG
jgi:hypothetical protein